MKVLVFSSKFNDFSITQKRNYIVYLLKTNNLKVVINSLVNNNLDIIENFHIMNLVSKTRQFKKKNNISNIELVSLIINTYVQQNKTKQLMKYFQKINNDKLRIVINHEIKNKTDFSKLKLCTDLNKKINKTNIKKKKVLEIVEYQKPVDDKKNDNVDDNKIVKKESILKKEIKSKKVKFSIFLAIFSVILAFSYISIGYCYYIINFYNHHIYPNIYLDNVLISDYSHKELLDYLDEHDKKIDNIISLKNDNDFYNYSYREIGVFSNKDNLQEKLINNYQKLNGFEKLYKIFTREELHYNFEYSINDDSYNLFLENLKSRVNVIKTNESFKIVNGSINYQKGINGFTLDESNIKEDVIASLNNDFNEIILNGNVESVNNKLYLINKKVSSFTTYYNEALGRAYNIRNAVSKLNGTIIYSGDTFSFYKVVGPYNGSRGYIFYGKDVGSGVCQVSTTIYNAALAVNLPITARENHGEMVYYVDYGLDATVYGSSVDFKFRNNSNYPIYIEASAYNGTLTVSFWSNDSIIQSGYSYKPRVEQVSSLGFKTYLDTYYNNNFVSTKYLNSSYYIKGK